MAKNQQMLKDIDEAVKVGAARGGIDLDAWEEDFVKSIRTAVKRGWELTPKRLVALTKIWDRI
jgi:hypothetical protein